jgi:hypothetical protein
MRAVEFYFLLDDYTWNTKLIDIPQDILGGTPSEDENAVVDYVYKNVKLDDKVVIVGVYCWADAYSEENI